MPDNIPKGVKANIKAAKRQKSYRSWCKQPKGVRNNIDMAEYYCESKKNYRKWIESCGFSWKEYKALLKKSKESNHV